MSTTRNLLLGGVMAAFCCSIGNAQLSYSNSLAGATLIYSNSFDGGEVDINGTAPSYINPDAPSLGGTTSALFDVVTNNAAAGYYANQDGTLGSLLDSVLLPFTPVSGYVYTLSASLTFAKQPPAGGWGALGFAANFPPSNGSASDPRFGSTLVNGNPWALLNYAAQGGGAVFYDTRSHSLGGVPNLMNSLNTPYTINMVVDTTSSPWHTALFVAGTFVKDSVYTANPTIRSIGYGQTTTTAGAYKWNSLALSAAPIVILQQPVSAGVNEGSAFTNTVVVAATSPSYQWFKDGAPIDGATNDSLIFDSVAVSDASDNYYVVITNSLSSGSITSAVASLTVHTTPVIISQLPATHTNLFTLFAGANPQFSISAGGEQPISYQWYANGVAVAGQTNTAFTWTNVPAGTISTYCVASNNAGQTSSAVWTASVLAQPTAPYPAALLSLQPVAYWRLNEGPDDYAGDNGVLALDYAGGNNGIYTNAVLGVSGYSLTEPGITAPYFSSFATPDSDVFNIQGVDFAAPAGNSAVFSVTAWVTGVGSQPNNAGIVSKGYAGADQFVLDVSGNKYRFSIRDAAGNLYSATATVGPSGGWDFLVGVCDEVNGSLTLYVNGAPAASAAIAPGSGLLASTRPMTIGARSSSPTSNNDWQFSGFVNDVALFKSALSAGQEAALYTAAGYSMSLSFVPPPPNVVYQANTTLTIPASAFGATNLGYYWTDLTTGALLGSGAITTFETLDATLTIPNASPSLSGDQLELVITNDTSYNNWFVTLYCPPPPVTLDYSDPILYSNYFDGGTWSIAGTPLTAANALVGGTNTTWDVVTNNAAERYAAYADGTLAANLNSVLLPFTPHPGYIYTLSASLTFTVTPPAGGWGGLGFATKLPASNSGVVDPRIGSSYVGGNGWALLNMYANGGGAILNADGGNKGSMANLMTALNTPYDIKLVLDTTGAQWSVALYVAGTFVANYVYTAGNPSIASFGYTQTTTTAGAFKWNYIALSQEAPGGVPPYLLAPLPPANVTLLADTSLTIPASAFGSVPVGYYWSNTNTAAVMGAGTTNNVAPLLADLSVADVPVSWNGNTLALIVTNAYGTNISLVSLTVTNAVNPNPPPIQYSVAEQQLTLSWPTNMGWTLQVQTNSPGVGLGNNWVDVPGSTTITSLVLPVSQTNGSVFYRLHLLTQ